MDMRDQWLNGEKNGGHFYEKELQKTSQELRIEKVLKRKGWQFI